MPFRDQHIRHFSTLASIRRPRLINAIALLLIIATIASITFFAMVPWVQTAPGLGRVTALNPNDRVQDINALVSGRIEEWYVRDGSYVEVGDPIVKIIDNDEQLLERLQAERAQVVAKLEAARSAVSTAEIDLNRMEGLFDKGLAARRDFEQARIRVDDLSGRVAEAAAELNRVDVNISRQSVQVVRAPRNGVILRVNAGDAATFISAGDPVATFVPSDVERAVELFVDGRDVALVRPGAKVRLQFEGWPAVQFSGWPSVAVGTFAGEVVAVDPSANAGGGFRILVTEDKSDPQEWPDLTYVRFGSSARGWVLLETVSVGYELWRQLNNFPPEFPPAEQDSASQASGGLQ
ncbi:MAG: HlyD family efflux transporter periplasmic adaptor subunit [Pseudomonadota bacterium]